MEILLDMRDCFQFGEGLPSWLNKDAEGFTFKMGFIGKQYLEKSKNVSSSLDILFRFVLSRELNKIRDDPKTFFVFDYTKEGTSNIGMFNFFECLTASGLRHGIPPNKIFFLTSNLLDEEVYSHWQAKNYPNYKINVLSFNYWDNVQDWDHTHYGSLINVPKPHGGNSPNSIDDTVNALRNGNDIKNFLCLNRNIRPFRLLSIYNIFNSCIRSNTLISYDKLSNNDLTDLKNWVTTELGRNLDESALMRLRDSSPSILDFSCFEHNLAFTSPKELFSSTLCNLANETLTDTYNNTSMFYTEKTFKPMLYNQPVLILGQPRINTYFEKLGYKTYKNYFDLSFDTVENDFDRLSMQISMLEKLNDQLNSMNIEQKIEWLLQDRDTLEHNKQVMLSQDYNKRKQRQFIELCNIS